ncbi:uncharacterized protein LY89DRAFT_120136 [Mollisia scopiformis]|uniref:AB hydrolase-1 domain-containing protein n=1 Tax=Mollisia scopiformis TaxID=149040 RepID=A0A194X4G5_MOLSC|nr:uncharacterized protein LY89DRAFT_120136 [Mollisia scopiformis]KUJ14717.1 hypothetical protein LY89DRAFT_120136 [Mollisia scopiformis]
MSALPHTPLSIEPEFLAIPSKPQSPICFTFFPAINSQTSTSSVQHLIVFINGLGLPAASWLPSISLLRSQPSCPTIITYDRFGQGLTTSRDPLDGTSGKELGHDFLDVATDLHEIILTISTKKLGLNASDVAHGGKLHLLLVGASIGAPIARLYVQHHPGTVAGMILLDSNIANVNYSDFLPDPSSPDFDPKKMLGEDCTLEQYREARAKLVAMFDLNVKNPEMLDRTTSPKLLPHADKPALKGVGGVGLRLMIVGHDPETFAEMSFQMMGTPRTLSRITNAYWAEYNQGLTKITDEKLSGPVIIANGCGHFIQKDDPIFVADTIMNMIKALEW